MIDLLRKCTAGERSAVLDILHRQHEETTPEQIESVIRLIEHYQADVYAEGVCTAKAQESLTHLERLPPGAERDLLGQMLEFLVNRQF